MQTRKPPFFAMAGLYLTVGLLAVVGKLTVEAGLLTSLPRLRWLLVHFVTIGGMTQALFGALPSLLGRVTGSRRTPDSQHRWAQWLTLNAGYPLVLVGMATGSTVTAVAGATVVLVALGLLAWTSLRLGGEDSSPDSVAVPGLARFYRLAPWFLVVGILAAFGMLLGYHGPGGYFGSLEAHVHANVWGFLALVVAATLLVVVPALAGTDLRYPRLAPVTFWGMTLGVSGLVAGPWLARNELTILGLAVYVVGTVALLANVVGTHRAAGCARDARIGHVLGAYLWLVFPVPWAPLVLVFPERVPAGPIELAAINGLVFGWMLQLAMAFLPAVVAVAGRRADDGRLDLAAALDDRLPGPSWPQVGAANLGVLALWLVAFPPFGGVADVLTGVGFALVAAAWARFVVSLWRSLVGTPRPPGGRPAIDRGPDRTPVPDHDQAAE